MRKPNFKGIAKGIGELSSAYMERQRKIDHMVNDLIRNGASVTDMAQLRAVATTLVDNAEVIWKR